MTIAFSSPASAGDALARRNALVLATASGVAGGNAAVVFATAALVGRVLGPSPAWATAPVTTFVIGTALAMFPANLAMRRHGRRAVFMAGNLSGAGAGLLGALAIQLASFPLFCLATMLAGVYQAIISSYRFAAADTATPAYRPRAISLVLTGGVAGAIIGPQVVNLTKDVTAPLFIATFLAQALLAVAAMFITGRFVDAPAPDARAAAAARPLGDIARMPRFVVAVLCGTAAQALMNMVMTSAPLAMALCGYSVAESTNGIMLHVVAMYGPSFVTGAIIARFGKTAVCMAGMAMLLACALVGLAGVTVAHFWVALVLLGVGWNFAFVAASAMVTDCHAPSERNKVQGLNDTLIFATTACGSLLSGFLLDAYGWTAINLSVLPVAIACALAVLLMGAAQDGRPKAA